MDLGSVNSSLTSLAAQQQLSSNQMTQASSTRVNDALKNSTQQAQKQAEGARVKLSALGKVSAGLANVRDAATSLQDTSKTTNTEAGAAKALNNFVKAFNDQNASVKSLTAQSGGTLSSEYRVKAGTNDVNRSATNDSGGQNSLSSIGVTVQSDGSLKVDAKAFAAAYKANPDSVKTTLANLGERTGAAANRQLSSTGAIGAAQNSAKALATASEARQSNLQAQATAAQQAIDNASQANSQVSSLIASQVANYQKVFSL
jgi:flagellar hook-associated protein 2